ncbi:MAG TPA: holo-ACP synthase [Candidatus Limiplasma sp.]|nr:holo-ACP synthase [Candidatus Limiplasma sp.]HRX08899.1 holo-ACP synthase [Candidatus Limiplasma sp.]
MIGLGIDVCQVERIEKALQKGDGFLNRYYTQEEREYLRDKTRAQSAAGMYAAKEAFLKALGVGLSGGVALSDIGVAHDERGCPTYALSVKAVEAMRLKGAQSSFLSITHDGGIAAAVCVLE